MRILAASGLLCACLFYYALCANDLSAGFTSDDAIYLLLADLYTFAGQSHLPVYTLVREQALFPPLFPLLLGLLGGGSADPAQAALVSGGLLLIGGAVAGGWTLQQTRSLPVTSLLTGLLLLLPGTLVLAQEIWSEFLFIPLLYAIFLIADRETHHRHHWLIIAILIALATLTRTAGVALLPPFWLLLYRNRVQSFWLAACVSTLPFLIWYVTREVLRGSPGYTDILVSTLADMDMSILLQHLYTEPVVLFESLRWLFAGVNSGMLQHGFATVILLTLLIPAVRTLWQRTLALRFDALFSLVYLAVVMTWPYDDIYYVSRFLYPLLPILLLYACLGSIHFLVTPAMRTTGTIAALLGFAILSGPSLLQYTQRAFANVPDELKPYRHDRSWLLATDANTTILEKTRFLLETLPQLANTVPEDECLLAFQAPLVMLYTKRITGVLPSSDSSGEQFRHGTARCRYIVAMPVSDAARNTPEYYPMQRLPASAYEQTTFYADPQAGYGTAIYLLRRFADTIAPE